MAKGKKTGGRKPGSRNKVTLSIAAEVAATGETPKDIMLHWARTLHIRALGLLRAAENLAKGGDGEGDVATSTALIGQACKCVELAVDCASKAAPYCNPRLAQIAHTGADGGPLSILHSFLDEIRGNTRKLPGE
jgi:hypothetical protein